MRGIIYLEDGTIYEGNGFGSLGTTVGELVFNTSMTGYEEILTDPSYAGQIITMTYPLIGNYGVNADDRESKSVYAKGFIVREVSNTPSNYLSEGTVDSMLKEFGVVGVSGVDTRSITRRIRSKGAQKCIISNENLSLDELKEKMSEIKLKTNFMDEVSTKEVIEEDGNGPKVVLYDFGAKANIVRNLKKRGCKVFVVPYNTPFEELEKYNPDGVMLSNGPGDPATVTVAIENVKKIVNKYPTFGICLGHQILALAMGGETYKMKYGHRGGNHGVYDIEKDKAYITSQNHGYAVDAKSLENKDMVVTHINLNDNTVEGIKHKNLPVFSVQFHPEGSPGPEDSAYLFDKFVTSMRK